ncbi:MAG: hypothetical protein H6Q86_1730 [candidate division NC10 bacterium]|nr:hypothetical protein [candidate division NC10 bacterium]
MGTPDNVLKRALEWIAAESKANPAADRLTLIDQASNRFHLSPLQAEHLYRHLAAPAS